MHVSADTGEMKGFRYPGPEVTGNCELTYMDVKNQL